MTNGIFDFIGVVENVRHYKPETGFSILEISAEDKGDGLPFSSFIINEREGSDQKKYFSDVVPIVVVIGIAPELVPGETVIVKGSLVSSETFGEQIKATFIGKAVPVTPVGIERFLASGLIKGIGEHLATEIVKTFGNKTIEVFDHDPDMLIQVSGIGFAKLETIKKSWLENKSYRDLMHLLDKFEISTKLGLKIYNTYGTEAVKILNENPYQLAYDIRGVGFLTSDRVALANGFPKDHPERIKAGIIYVLDLAEDNGHVYLPRPLLIAETSKMLGHIAPDQINEMINALALWNDIRGNLIIESGVEEERIYLSRLHNAETGTAIELGRLLRSKSRLSDVTMPVLEHFDHSLTEEQLNAVRMALAHPVSIMTGGPGTGKSYAIKSLVLALESLGKKYKLCAPTGLAAKRVSKATEGRTATTIHSMLGLGRDSDLFDEEGDILDIDLLVMDESSMPGIYLINRTLKAVPEGAHIIFVGDIDQLPSIEAGNVLRDMIASGAIPVTRLTHIFRQGRGSLIVENAHRINQGKMPILDMDLKGDKYPDLLPDFFFFSADNGSKAADRILDLVTSGITKNFGYSRTDIMVLAPMRKGPAGIYELNNHMQEKFNKNPRFTIPGGGKLSVGDRVMCISNHRVNEVSIANGEQGIVSEVRREPDLIVVEIDDQVVEYNFTDYAEKYMLAYAQTIHKSQGSEYPVVIMPILNEHYVMLVRNLLYTGITRGKALVVIVGQIKAIEMAINNNKVAKRYTNLAEKITSCLESR